MKLVCKNELVLLLFAMIITFFVLGGVALAQTQNKPHAHDGHAPHGQPSNVFVPKPRATPRIPVLPPAPAGVTDVKFTEFFVTPVGRYGLELTPKMQSLHNKRVRLVGFMVRRETPTPGAFLAASLPISIEEHEGGLADLPPNTLRVLVPWAAKKQIPQITDPFILTGRLEIGPREEADGSVSTFRLTLDAPLSPPKPAVAGKRKSAAAKSATKSPVGKSAPNSGKSSAKGIASTSQTATTTASTATTLSPKSAPKPIAPAR